MAKIEALIPKILHWEGGYANLPDDKGGPTKMGITLNTWRSIGYDKDGDADIDAEDIKQLDATDFMLVVRKFWNRWRADELINQAVANILVDWVYTSGKWGIVIPQRLVGVLADGKVGPKTVAAVNARDQKKLFDAIYAEKAAFFKNIAKNNPSQKKFLKGWLNRLADFTYWV